MQENKEVKYYTRSNGEKVDISTMETTHLIHSLSKQFRELFEAKNKDEYANKMTQINNLKEDLYGRFNKFHDGLGE